MLGRLIFCSEVVEGGRTAMQSMLRQFAGLEVDWAWGRVRSIGGGEWGSVTLTDGFWRDVSWWRSAVLACSCVPMQTASLGVAAVTGTDASDHGAGELAWIDGGREESVMLFTAAERRRPINFRELLGNIRVIEVWG